MGQPFKTLLHHHYLKIVVRLVNKDQTYIYVFLVHLSSQL